MIGWNTSKQMLDTLMNPWPWYVAGPLIGAVVPLLLWIGGRQFGVSTNLRHLCAVCIPSRLAYFRYDWRREGGWNLLFALGIALGGFIGVHFLSEVADPRVYAPVDAVSWAALLTPRGLLTLLGGGFLVGFGARWAGGCTSGHAITGLANLQWPSLVAVIAFFAGGLLMTHVLLPALFQP
jgi:uncharacterized membrane protein YedE/YeeE